MKALSAVLSVYMRFCLASVTDNVIIKFLIFILKMFNIYAKIFIKLVHVLKFLTLCTY